MSSLRAFPQNIDISPSKDQLRDLKIVKDFTNPRSGVSVELDGLDLTREGKEALLEWLYETQGRFENPEAYFTDPTGTTFDMFINLKELSVRRRAGISGAIEMRKSFKHFFDNIDVLTYNLLDREGLLTDDLFVDFPFVLVPDDLKQQKIIQQIYLASLLFQLYITIKEASDLVAMFLNPLNVAVIIAQTVGFVLYLTLTIISIIETSLTLVELYYPPVRYYKAISDFDLMRKACEYLGYTFESDFMENEMYGMHTIGRPEGINESIVDRLDNYFSVNYQNVGYPRENDTVKTAGDIFNFYLDNFDTRLFVYDGIVKLERRSYYQNNSNVSVKPTMSDQEAVDDSYTFNDDQTWGRKYYKWSFDQSDIHSIEVNQDDARFEAITTQINTINPDLVHLTGLDEYSAPFALVKRKNGYTGVESSINKIFQKIGDILSELNVVFQSISGTLGQTLDLSGLLIDRIGIGVFEKNFWSVTRKVWGVPEVVADRTILKQPSNFLDIIGQTAINNNFNTDLYVINNNFALKELTLPFNGSQFNNLLQNNYVNYEGYNDGVEALSIAWYPFRYKADIAFELPDGSAFNTQTTIL